MPDSDLPIEEWTKLKQISEKLSSKISSLNQKLDSRLESSYLITNHHQMTSPKQVNESRLERENIFKTDTQIKTIKKQQVASNCHSHSPFKETIITLPKEINPKIKQQIIEREKKIFIRKNVCNEFSNQIEFMNRTEFLSKNDVMNQNDLLKNEFSKKKSEFSETNARDNHQNCEKSQNNEKNLLDEENCEILRKIKAIKEILGVDLKENIEKFYSLTQKVHEKKGKTSKNKTYRKEKSVNNDKSPQINVFQVPTIPIEDFMDETEITIKQMKQDVTEELQSLYGKVAKIVI